MDVDETCSSPAQPDPDVVVVGAGVIGLTVAVCLAESGSRVRVYSAVEPPATTSAVASAMVGPALTPGPVGRWEQETVTAFTALADVEGTGVRMRRGRLASRLPGAALPGLERCPVDAVPPGFAGASIATLPIVDMPVYLAHLRERLLDAGGRIVVRHLTSLREVAGEAPLVANCAGLGARELVPDPGMRSVSGQQVIVENPGLDEFFLSSPFEPDWTAYWPHQDRVVLGGSQNVGDEDTDPDPDLARVILARCRAVEPRLREARVLGHQVGLRPSRPAVRLESDIVGGARCVHDYGHGGVGVTLSWGTARETVSLLLDGHREMRA